MFKKSKLVIELESHYYILRPKKSCVSGNPTLPIGTGRPYTFSKIPFLSVGVLIIEVAILKKKNPADPTFKTVALNTRFIFLPKSELLRIYVIECKYFIVYSNNSLLI